MYTDSKAGKKERKVTNIAIMNYIVRVIRTSPPPYLIDRRLAQIIQSFPFPRKRKKITTFSANALAGVTINRRRHAIELVPFRPTYSAPSNLELPLRCAIHHIRLCRHIYSSLAPCNLQSHIRGSHPSCLSPYHPL